MLYRAHCLTLPLLKRRMTRRKSLVTNLKGFWPTDSVKARADTLGLTAATMMANTKTICGMGRVL